MHDRSIREADQPPFVPRPTRGAASPPAACPTSGAVLVLPRRTGHPRCFEATSPAHRSSAVQAGLAWIQQAASFCGVSSKRRARAKAGQQRLTRPAVYRKTVLDLLRILYFASIALVIWMTVDAVRRRAEFYWYLIILFVPFGGVIYFFMVKIHDYDLRRLLPSTRPALALPDLQRKALETPSITNKLALADGLEEAERYDEAARLFSEALSRDEDNLRALHGLARCRMGTGQFDEACQHLEKLLGVDNAFRDYSAALDYAEALWQSGRKDDTIDLLEGLVSVSSRVNHRVALAHYQMRADRTAEARDVLDRALKEYEGSPEYVKRRDRKWANKARDMLAKLG